jgi:two-component system phosphate regulon sensor histidine kinase PhoR
LNLNAGHSIILGDKTHLINSLCNLADNAIKYSKGAPHLTVETTNEGKFIIISISDKGIGIEKKYHTNIFKKYFRVPTGDVHNVKGFGLGLAYVKKIIELHQGRIELRSDKENGTTFTIKLPNV